MMKVDLKHYAPIISDRTTGDSIYREIKSKHPETNRVEIYLTGIVSMATYSAKQIFGRLYIELGSDIFYRNIILKDVSEDVLFLIKLGIKHALREVK